MISDALGKFFELECIDSVKDVLDPCAGGNIENETHYYTDMPYVKVLRKEYGMNPDTMDIREDSLADAKTDFLKVPPDKKLYDLIITNPPFAIAEEVIRHSLEFCKKRKVRYYAFKA